jgi:membrane-bound metal-dependent hydrolase YbcI (DUF457 family)
MLIGAGTGDLVSAAVPGPKRWHVWLAAGMLGALPDVDIVVGLATGRGGTLHGTFTHSITAAVVVALAAWLVGGWRWGLIAGTSYGSHLVVDLLDARGPTNVELLWPFAHAESYAIAPVFPTVPFETGGGAVHAALSLLDPHILKFLFWQTCVGAVFAAFLFAAGWLVRRLHRPPPPLLADGANDRRGRDRRKRGEAPAQ